MNKPLPRRFYEPSADQVATALLGHWLVRQTPQGVMGGWIVETEAYLVGDPACHAYKGETLRNRSMWGRPGQAYVYLIYGFHYCVNAVCRPPGVAEAVLIRALEPAAGTDLMFQHRPAKSVRELTNGPGKLCAALNITRDLDGSDLCRADSPLWIAENQTREALLRTSGPVAISPRIGITKGAELPLRFYLSGSSYASK